MNTLSDPSILDDPTFLDGPDDMRHIFAVRHRRPRPGDRALCGIVKRRPTFPSNEAARASGVPLCAECDEISARIA